MLAIDPGPAKSAYVVYENGQLEACGILRNEDMLEVVQDAAAPLVVEGVASYGMAVGRDVFETVQWAGRFIEASPRTEVYKVYRKDVKMHLCGQTRARDSNIRQALVDKFGGIGGDKAAKGTKKSPGPLYGVSKDMWAALAVAVTFDEAPEVAECITKARAA